LTRGVLSWLPMGHWRPGAKPSSIDRRDAGVGRCVLVADAVGRNPMIAAICAQISTTKRHEEITRYLEEGTGGELVATGRACRQYDRRDSPRAIAGLQQRYSVGRRQACCCEDALVEMAVGPYPAANRVWCADDRSPAGGSSMITAILSLVVVLLIGIIGGRRARSAAPRGAGGRAIRSRRGLFGIET